MILNEKFDIPPVTDLLNIRKIRTEWDSKSPLQKWSHLYSIGRSSLNILGFPVFRDDPSLYWFSYVFFVYMGIDVLLVFYTAYYFLLQGDIAKFLPCTALLIGPLCCSAPLGYASVSEAAAMFHSLVDFGGRYIHPNVRKDNEYTEVCSNHIDETVRSFFIKMGLMLLSLQGSMIGPCYAYIMHGIKATMTNVQIPYIDEGSNAEFVANLMLASTIGIHGFIGYIGLEVSMALFSDVVTIVPKLIGLEFRRIDAQLEKRGSFSPQLHHTFLNIIKQSLDSDDYVNCIGDFLYYRTLVTPALFTYAIGLAIFCQYTMDFSPGYGMAMICWVQIYYVCEFGESIEDDGFAEVLYDTKWYNLPIEYQKHILQLIHRKQNGITITVGPFGNINRELFKIITNKVYSFVMFLLNFAV